MEPPLTLLHALTEALRRTGWSPHQGEGKIGFSSLNSLTISTVGLEVNGSPLPPLTPPYKGGEFMASFFDSIDLITR